MFCLLALVYYIFKKMFGHLCCAHSLHCRDFCTLFLCMAGTSISNSEMAHMNKVKWNNSETALEKHETIHKWYKQNHREKGILD